MPSGLPILRLWVRGLRKNDMPLRKVIGKMIGPSGRRLIWRAEAKMFVRSYRPWLKGMRALGIGGPSDLFGVRGRCLCILALAASTMLTTGADPLEQPGSAIRKDSGLRRNGNPGAGCVLRLRILLALSGARRKSSQSAPRMEASDSRPRTSASDSS